MSRNLFAVLCVFLAIACGSDSNTDTSASKQADHNNWDEPAVDAYTAAAQVKPENVNEYLWVLAVRWCSGDRNIQAELEILTKDDFDLMLEYVLLIEEAMYPDESTTTALPDGTEVELAWRSSLPGCGSYWGTYRHAEFAELRDNGPRRYSYYWSPNCYMPAPGTDCGDDGDNMVSFWMGPDYTTRWGNYKVDGRTPAIDLFLQWKTLFHSGSANSRLYISDGYGNAYVCLPNRLKPDNLRFGW